MGGSKANPQGQGFGAEVARTSRRPKVRLLPFPITRVLICLYQSSRLTPKHFGPVNRRGGRGGWNARYGPHWGARAQNAGTTEYHQVRRRNLLFIQGI